MTLIEPPDLCDTFAVTNRNSGYYAAMAKELGSSGGPLYERGTGIKLNKCLKDFITKCAEHA